LYNQSGTIGDDINLSSTGDGILRALEDLTFIMDTAGTDESQFSWREGGSTVGTSTELMYLDSEELASAVFISAAAGMKSSHATVGMGYGSGADGSVTQVTNRTTGVTLNNVCGVITTDNTSLAAGAAATFTVSNTTTNIGYAIIPSIRSGATTNQTKVYITAVANNSFDITVENNHASTAETGAIVINFATVTVES